MTPTAVRLQKEQGISVRMMQERDIATVRTIFRNAFALFVGAPNPETFQIDRECIATRWRAAPAAALVAERGAEVVGSNFAANWGSFGFFGPLTIRTDLWDRGIAQQLLARTVDLFDQWGLRESGLFTFPHSAKHVSLYQKFGYWPRFLTAVMTKHVAEREGSWVGFSTLSGDRRAEAVRACRELTDPIFDGLDVTCEIEAVAAQKLGDTVLLMDGDRLDGFAVCYCGEGTEAGADNCYVKFAASRPDSRSFQRLLEACEGFAVARGVHKIEAGVNLARGRAYRQMLESGFRTQMQGVAMQRHDAVGYNRPDVFVVDDWR